MALTAFNRKISGLNAVFFVGIKALTAFNREHHGLNGVFVSV